METATRILTISEVAEVLRCSKAHVNKALSGRIAGVPQLAHLSLGRRKLVPKDWFDQWLEASRTKSGVNTNVDREVEHGIR
jgi:excisionase family DNA binding protein